MQEKNKIKIKIKTNEKYSKVEAKIIRNNLIQTIKFLDVVSRNPVLSNQISTNGRFLPRTFKIYGPLLYL